VRSTSLTHPSQTTLNTIFHKEAAIGRVIAFDFQRQRLDPLFGEASLLSFFLASFKLESMEYIGRSIVLLRDGLVGIFLNALTRVCSGMRSPRRVCFDGWDVVAIY